MRSVSLGIGFLIAFLLSIATYLFGATGPKETIALFLVLVGIWTVTFGALMAKNSELYISGWGVVIILLATFIILPIQYTAGLVIVGIVAVILYYYLATSRRPMTGMKKTT